MKQRSAFPIGVVAALCGLCSLFVGRAGHAQSADLLDMERALAGALSAGDPAKVAAHLHPELLWIDAAGVAAMIGTGGGLPAPLIDPKNAGKISFHEYGRVAVAQIDRDKRHVLHVWVKAAAHWQLLVYQEVRSLDQAPTVTPGAGADCENPCRTVGMQPANDAQTEVIAAYQELETAAESKNVDLWSSRVAAEFIAASSNSDRLFDKQSRIDGLRQSTMRGLSPTPLVSGRIYDLPGAAVMVSEHVPDRGNPLRVTRVWVNHEGRWVETLSYQTAVQSGSLAR
jgi:hypothetical protein